jgi:hypothetical protein
MCISGMDEDKIKTPDNVGVSDIHGHAMDVTKSILSTATKHSTQKTAPTSWKNDRS